MYDSGTNYVPYFPTPTGGDSWNYINTPPENPDVNKDVPRRRGNVHWLDSDAWYAGLEWGVDPISAFVDRIKPWINDVNNPELEDGDVIIGKDKNGLEVVIHANKLGDDVNKHAQQEAPK